MLQPWPNRAAREWAATLVLALLVSVSAVAQTPPDSQTEPFGQLNQRLLESAELALSRTAQLAETAEEKPLDQHAPDPEAVQKFALRYRRGRTAELQAAVERVHALVPLVGPVMRKQGIPTELLAVVLIESAGRPDALSPRGARGLWQFVPATARRYGLTVEARRDDRLEVQKSTWAAGRYLSDLKAEFKDWRLALAAYNAGEAVVRRAIQRAGTADFDVLSARRLLPEETRHYVPAVLNAAELFGNRSFSGAGASGQSATARVYAEPRAD